MRFNFSMPGLGQGLNFLPSIREGRNAKKIHVILLALLNAIAYLTGVNPAKGLPHNNSYETVSQSCFVIASDRRERGNLIFCNALWDCLSAVSPTTLSSGPKGFGRSTA